MPKKSGAAKLNASAESAMKISRLWAAVAAGCEAATRVRAAVEQSRTLTGNQNSQPRPSPIPHCAEHLLRLWTAQVPGAGAAVAAQRVRLEDERRSGSALVVPAVRRVLRQPSCGTPQCRRNGSFAPDLAWPPTAGSKQKSVPASVLLRSQNPLGGAQTAFRPNALN
jgi:hypothetical protein